MVRWVWSAFPLILGSRLRPENRCRSLAVHKVEVLTADVVFCCVPAHAHAHADGSLDTHIVEALVRDFASRNGNGKGLFESR